MNGAIMLGDDQRKPVNLTQFTTAAYDFVLVPQGQAMAQPFAQEHVELGFSSGWCIAAFG
jgi:hypothetical protein